MSDECTLYPPVVKQAVRDRRLAPLDKLAAMALWQELSPLRFLPMKAETLGAIVGAKRQSAARSLSALVRAGYLLERRAGPRAVREFMLVNHNPLPQSPPPRALRRVAPLVTHAPAAP